MAGPIRIAVLANASKARSELSGTKKELGDLGKAGDQASSRLKSALGASESVFTRLRNEANSALSKIPRDAAGAIDKTSAEFQSLSPEMRRAVQDAARVASNELRSGAFGRAGEEAGKDAADGIRSSMVDGVKKAGPALAGALAAVGAGQLFADALDFDASVDRLGASLGATPAEAKRYGEIAGRLYSQAFGENMQAVTSAVGAVRGSFDNLDGSQLEGATRRALTFADVFEVDVARAAQVAGQSVKNGLAKDATEAFDLLTRSSQKVAPSLREDVIDAADEYGGFFRQIGYSGEQAFSTLVRGADKGMYGIDKAGDAIKEFSFLSTDLSTSSRDAYDSIGLDAEKMADRILAGGGTARRATNDIIDGLLGIQNPAERANAAVALFGTPIEDLNKGEIPEFLRSLRNGKSELDNFRGATDRAAEQAGGNAKNQLTQFGRGLKQDVTERIVEALPEIRATASELSDTFGPSLKVAGDIAKSAGEFFSQLPEPIKQIAAGAGLAAFAVPRMAGAVGSLGSSLATTGTNLATARTNTSQFLTQIRNSETRSAALRGSLTRMGGAARGAAGVAGLGALAVGASTSNEMLGTLANVGGGALSGFAVGGPIGAAIGGSVALLGDLASNAGRATEKAEVGARSWKDYAGTLDQVSGAATEATGAMAFQALAESNALSSLRQLGIDNRTAVNAVLGRGDASERVTEILGREQAAVDRLRNANLRESQALTQRAQDGLQVSRAESDALDASEAEVTQRQKAIDAIREQTGEAEKAAGAVRRQAAATRDFTGSLKGIPPNVKSDIQAGNIEPTRKGIKDLIRDHDSLGRKRVRTLVRAAGLAETDRGVRRLADRLLRVGRRSPNMRPYTRGLTRGVRAAENGVGRQTREIDRRLNRTGANARPNLNPFTRLFRNQLGGTQRSALRGGVDIARALSRSTGRARPELRQFSGGVRRDVDDAGRTAGRGAQNIADGLRRGTSRARPDLGGFNSGISAGVSTGRNIAASGGSSVGATLKSSVINGFAGTGDALAASAAAAVNRAIDAANAAARNRGGGGGGRRESTREALGRTGAGGAMESLQREAQREGKAGKLLKSLRAAATRDLRSVQERLKALGKEWKRDEDRVNRVTASLAKQSTQLVANAKNQARLKRSVKSASDALKEARRVRDEYAASIRSSFVEYGNLASIEEGHLNSPGSLVDSLREQVQRATRFRDAIAKLRDTSLNTTSMKQLLAAGPEQGLAAAEALVAGIGQGAIGQVNDLQRQLSEMGKTLGDQVASDFESGNIRRRLNTLTRKQGNLRDAQNRGRQLASSLLRAFRNQLGGPAGKKQNAAESLLGDQRAGANRARVMGRELARAQRNGFNEEQKRQQQRAARAAATSPKAIKAGAAASAKQQRQQVDVKVRVTPAELVNLFVLGQAINRAQRHFLEIKNGRG